MSEVDLGMFSMFGRTGATERRRAASKFVSYYILYYRYTASVSIAITRLAQAVNHLSSS